MPGGVIVGDAGLCCYRGLPRARQRAEPFSHSSLWDIIKLKWQDNFWGPVPGQPSHYPYVSVESSLGHRGQNTSRGCQVTAWGWGQPRHPLSTSCWGQLSYDGQDTRHEDARWGSHPGQPHPASTSCWGQLSYDGQDTRHEDARWAPARPTPSSIHMLLRSAQIRWAEYTSRGC